jgi:anaerobic ribonucleoside-triphosphate reductase
MSSMEKQIDLDSREKMVGEGVKFERIRRITGYLVGTMNRWNNAKRAEERDRVKHASVRKV